VRSRPAIWTSFSTRSDLAALLPKDQPKELLVFRNDEGQLLSVFERGAKILGFILSFAVKRDEPMARSSANQEDCASQSSARHAAASPVNTIVQDHNEWSQPSITLLRGKAIEANSAIICSFAFGFARWLATEAGIAGPHDCL